MPNSKTFSVRPVRALIEKCISKLGGDAVILDPYTNQNKLGTVTNDLDPQFDTDYHLEATEFLDMFDRQSVDMVLYDPPYSPRQLSECYKKLGKSVTTQDTQAAYWSKQKARIGEIVKKGGYVISFGWNSGRMGKKTGLR